MCNAHCNCMAGLGETCTHIAAVLFYLEATVRIRGNPTCTQAKCEWVMPSFLKKIEYLPIRDIDFTSARGKKRKLDEIIDSPEAATHSQTSGRKMIVKIPDDSEMDTFFENLYRSSTKPVVLSGILKYSDKYVPKSSLPEFPKPLQLLYNPKYLLMGYDELLNVCESLDIDMSEESAQLVEKETRLQHNSKLWFKYRAGRITASKMKSVCHTDASNPSQSLVKSVCYPEAFCFTSKQTVWGCTHEKLAKDLYVKEMKQKHFDFQVVNSGFVINPAWPYIGATPDGIVSCTCCGRGVLEIKCPYCHKGEDIEYAAAQDKKFCLRPSSDGPLHLHKAHAYFYQVQSQLFVCGVEYCDFCVCTFTDDVQSTIHIERITGDHVFWDDCMLKAQHFFRTCILPELLGKWYTTDSRLSGTGTCSTSKSQAIQQAYCYCRCPEKGKMIACDNTNCSIEWFHMNCLKIRTAPKGEWYCPSCRLLQEFRKVKKNV